MDILVGNFWANGPYPTGAWNTIKNFNSVLSQCLEPGKWVEADNGYVGHANKIKCSNNNCKPTGTLGMQSAVGFCYKTLNGHLKNWRILEKVYRHDIMVHGTVFGHVR